MLPGIAVGLHKSERFSALHFEGGLGGESLESHLTRSSIMRMHLVFLCYTRRTIAGKESRLVL
jgi:hypothetical protein